MGKQAVNREIILSQEVIKTFDEFGELWMRALWNREANQDMATTCYKARILPEIYSDIYDVLIQQNWCIHAFDHGDVGTYGIQIIGKKTCTC